MSAPFGDNTMPPDPSELRPLAWCALYGGLLWIGVACLAHNPPLALIGGGITLGGGVGAVWLAGR
jgi:hypothetical protein